METPSKRARLHGSSNANPHIELVKQEPFLPYADLWITTNKRAVFEHTWKINNFDGDKHSGHSMTRIFSDDVYKASYKRELVPRTYYRYYAEGYKSFSELSLHFTILSSQIAKSRVEFRTRAVTDSGKLIKAATFIDDLEVRNETPMFSVNNEVFRNGKLSLPRFEPHEKILISCKCWSPSWTCYHHKLPELKNNLIADVSSTYTSHKFSDLTIKVGSSEFKCHKALISCRSRFFARMLKEQKDEVTTLEDIDEVTFEKILRYIYTDQCDTIEANASELLPFASKYELEHLKMMCEKHLISSLSLENAVESLHLAIAYSASILQKYAFQYIGENISDILAKPNTMEQIMKYSIAELLTNA